MDIYFREKYEDATVNVSFVRVKICILLKFNGKTKHISVPVAVLWLDCPCGCYLSYFHLLLPAFLPFRLLPPETNYLEPETPAGGRNQWFHHLQTITADAQR